VVSLQGVARLAGTAARLAGPGPSWSGTRCHSVPLRHAVCPRLVRVAAPVQRGLLLPGPNVHWTAALGAVSPPRVCAVLLVVPDVPAALAWPVAPGLAVSGGP
jgi:hypothetical protein